MEREVDICELNAGHGVDIRNAYTTEKASKSFAHYIAEALRMKVVTQLKSSKFFSILLDGLTDNELLMAVYLIKKKLMKK